MEYSQQRNRVQAMQPRASNKPNTTILDSTTNGKQLGALKVTIPQTLSRHINKVNAQLKPLQTHVSNKQHFDNNGLKKATHTTVNTIPALLSNARKALLEKVDGTSNENGKEQPDTSDRHRITVEQSPVAPVGKHAEKNKHDSRLVTDAEVPTIISDHKRRNIYHKKNHLGSGAFARVYRVTTIVEEGGDSYAAKIIAKKSLTDAKLKQKMLSEVNIHRNLQHDYIVQFYQVLEDKHNIYILLEYCQNQTLGVMCKNRGYLTELETRYYMGQILSALRYLSDNRILHRDLKLGNILLDINMDCKIGDFGLAAILANDEDRKRTVCGTPHYIAPEVLFCKTGSGHNHRADMWSTGVLMYNLLYGVHPFRPRRTEKLYNLVRANADETQYLFPSNSCFSVSNYAKDMISNTLVNDPDQRMTVIQALKHPFLTKCDIPECIPINARFREPLSDELFPSRSKQQHYTRHNSSSTTLQATSSSISGGSKVKAFIRRAGDIDQSYADHRLNSPIKIMDEIIVDYRIQYPVPIEPTFHTLSHNSIIPVESPLDTASKKRLNNMIVSSSSKRICNNDTEVINIQDSQNSSDKSIDSDIPNVETLAINNETTAPSSFNCKDRPFAVPLALPHRKPVMEEMADHIKIMIERSSVFCKSGTTIPKPLHPDPDFEWYIGNIYIQHWIDFTASYGFAYILSDGSSGCLFNDGSTLTTHGQEHFYYMDHNAGLKKYNEKVFSVDSLPNELQKKHAILNKYQAYMKDKVFLRSDIPKATAPTKVLLFKYTVSKLAISFKLNNGVVQVNFFSHNKLVLYDKGRKMIFIDKNRQLSHYNTSDVFYSDKTEIIEALEYAFSVLQEQNAERQEAIRKERWKRY